MKCPYCDKERILKFGSVPRAGKGMVQRYVCKDCGRSFIENGEK